MNWSLRAFFVAGVFCAACGGGDRPPTSPPPASPTPPGTSNPPPGTTVIRGGERLGWDQSAPSQSAVQGYTFVLYVDGTARALSNVQCGTVATASGYSCSAQLPALIAGSHVLELAAVNQGVEGPRSAPFPVMVNPAATASGANTLPSVSSARIVCLDPAVDECYDAVTIASGVGVISDLTMASDGRAFFIENSRAVRVLGADGLSPVPALAADEGEQLVSLGLSPDFAHTRAVYVGSIEERSNGPEFTVRRYREVAGIFGQGAAIVAGLPAGAGSRVPLTVDAQEYIYVALPAASPELARLSAFAYNGHVLRFASDGSVPNDQASPIVMRGYDQPSAILYDVTGSRIWLAGTPGASGAVLATASIDSRRGDVLSSMTSALRESLGTAAGETFAMPSVAVRSRGEALELWLAEGVAYRATVAGNTAQRFRSVETGFGGITAVAASANDLLIVVQPTGGARDVRDVIRLVPRTAATPQ